MGHHPRSGDYARAKDRHRAALRAPIAILASRVPCGDVCGRESAFREFRARAARTWPNIDALSATGTISDRPGYVHPPALEKIGVALRAGHANRPYIPCMSYRSEVPERRIGPNGDADGSWGITRGRVTMPGPKIGTVRLSVLRSRCSPPARPAGTFAAARALFASFERALPAHGQKSMP